MKKVRCSVPGCLNAWPEGAVIEGVIDPSTKKRIATMPMMAKVDAGSATLAALNVPVVQRIDRLVTSPVLGLPIMALLLGLVFWLTVTGANVPSALRTTPIDPRWTSVTE